MVDRHTNSQNQSELTWHGLNWENHYVTMMINKLNNCNIIYSPIIPLLHLNINKLQVQTRLHIDVLRSCLYFSTLPITTICYLRCVWSLYFLHLPDLSLYQAENITGLWSIGNNMSFWIFKHKITNPIKMQHTYCKSRPWLVAYLTILSSTWSWPIDYSCALSIRCLLGVWVRILSFVFCVLSSWRHTVWPEN